MTVLFDQENKKKIKLFIGVVDSLEYFEDSKEWFERKLVVTVLRWILNDSEKWEEACSYNLNKIGVNIIRRLEEFDQDSDLPYETIFLICYRLLCEFEFSLDESMQVSSEFSELKRLVLEKVESYEGFAKSQIIYSAYYMPVDILKKIIQHPNIADIIQFNDFIAGAETKKLNYEHYIKEKELSVQQLKEKLDEYETAYNFVGLYDGFNQLSIKKISEVGTLTFLLVLIASVMIIPILSQTGALGIFSIEPTKDVYKLFALFGFELLLIYFFRVMLLQHKSARSQLLQIELRKTLCQFIQKYGDYSSDLKKKDPEVLAKFENIIFSSIVSEPENIPSTFDGIEQIGNLVEKLKK